MTWKELEALGVKRCCACFKSGKRCRRRAVAEHDFSYCAKHGWILKALDAANRRVIEGMKIKRRK